MRLRNVFRSFFLGFLSYDIGDDFVADPVAVKTIQNPIVDRFADGVLFPFGHQFGIAVLALSAMDRFNKQHKRHN